jgi:hypothetical protein
MRLRILSLLAPLLFVLSNIAIAQFLPNYVQSDNGINLSFFRQADINHDGHMDLVGIRGTEITVLLGNGQGGFGAPLNTAITGIDNRSTQFILADFNNDGNPDVLVIGADHVTSVPVVGVMLGNGTGTFEAPKETATLGSIPTQIDTTVVTAVTGDFNNDGKRDLAYFGGPGIVVMPGKGDGTFSSAITTSAPQGVAIGVGNLNADQNLDLVGVTQQPNNKVFVFMGKGDGSFEAPVISYTGGSWPLAVVDLNGDGYSDVILGPGFSQGQGMTVLLSDGAGHFPTTYSYGGPQYPIFAVHDLNGDGHPDIAAFASKTAPWQIAVYINNGNGSFAPGRIYLGDGAPAGIGLLTADFNNDGTVDLAFANSAGGISVLPGRGNGTFKGNFVGAGGRVGDVLANDIRAGSFNNDLKPDLVTVPLNTVLLGNGDGTFTISGGCSGSSTVAIGDFNGDGKQDFAGNVLSSNPWIQVCLGNGDGTFRFGGQFDQGIQHKLVLPGDFNNDGKLDLVASDQNGISVLLGNGDGTFQPGIPTAVNATFPTFAVADFNNDGKLDVAALTPSGIAIFLGEGNGEFKAPIVSTGPKTGFITVTDLNKDGKRDLVMTGGSGVVVMLGKGNGTFASPTYWALNANASTRAVVADFNADGHPDVALGVSGNSVEILFGDGLGNLSKPTKFRVGSTILGIAESDFNLDKKPDLAVDLVGEKMGQYVYDVVATLLHQ